MKINIFLPLIWFCLVFSAQAQQLLINGDFSNSWNGWPETSNSNLTAQFSNGNYCPQFAGNPYVYFGDQNESTGANNMIEGMYQTVTLPSNATSITLSFKLSINTLEDNPIPYDFLKVNLRSASGSLLTTIWNIDNSYGYYGLPGCSPWFAISSSIPSSYFGQTLQLAIECTTDNVLPTIFRIDDISLVANTSGSSGCNYSLSQNSYVCPNSGSNTYNNAVLVSTASGCSWSATVLSGSNWLATGSTGNGTGAVSVIVSANTSASPRTGIVSVGDQTFTVTQPGASCSYVLSTTNYVCPDASANTYSSVSLINTQANCSWSAVVTSGNSWLACSSSASGSGPLNIIVQSNETSVPRNGTISVEGQVLNITQPAGSSVGVSNSNIKHFKIWPSPAENEINFEGLQLNDLISVYDCRGFLILSEIANNESIRLNVSDWSRGVYFVSVGSQTTRFLLN